MKTKKTKKTKKKRGKYDESLIRLINVLNIWLFVNHHRIMTKSLKYCWGHLKKDTKTLVKGITPNSPKRAKSKKMQSTAYKTEVFFNTKNFKRWN